MSSQDVRLGFLNVGSVRRTVGGLKITESMGTLCLALTISPLSLCLAFERMVKSTVSRDEIC